MTAAVFADYAWLLNRKFTVELLTVVFIIGSCPSHGIIDNLKTITLEFLPANTTLVL